MAEFAIATGVLQVASAGISLTKTLYDFGSTASAAGEQTDFIARNISLYCRVLKTFGRQLKQDKPDHSAEALEVAQELQAQSKLLFKKIKELLPTSRGDRDGLSFKQKLMWNFKKGRVDYLVGQLEYLKSTVTLLLHVLSSVPKLRRYRRSKKTSLELKEEVSEELTEAQNLLYEQIRAKQQLPELAKHDTNDSFAAIAYKDDAPQTNSASDATQEVAAPLHHTLADIDAYAAKITGQYSNSLILQKTNIWLAQLYENWTTLAEQDSADEADVLNVDEITHLAASMATNPESPVTRDGTNFDTENVSEGEDNAETLHDDEEAKEIPDDEDENGSLFPGTQMKYSGGPKYQNCIAVLPLSDTLKQIASVKVELLDANELSPVVDSTKEDHQKHIASLQTRLKELEFQHKVHELKPLRQKYLAGLDNVLFSTNEQLRLVHNARGEAIRNDDLDWLEDLNEKCVPHLSEMKDWLRISRLEHQTWRVGDELNMGPSNCCTWSGGLPSITACKSYIKVAIRDAKMEIQSLKTLANTAEQTGDLQAASDLIYYQIPDLQHQLKGLEAASREVQKHRAAIKVAITRIELAERLGDLLTASDLTYYVIPDRQAQIKDLEAPSKIAVETRENIEEATLKLDQLRLKYEEAEHAEDLQTASDLKYYAIPDCEHRIKLLKSLTSVSSAKETEPAKAPKVSESRLREYEGDGRTTPSAAKRRAGESVSKGRSRSRRVPPGSKLGSFFDKIVG